MHRHLLCVVAVATAAHLSLAFHCNNITCQKRHKPINVSNRKSICWSCARLPSNGCIKMNKRTSRYHTTLSATNKDINNLISSILNELPSSKNNKSNDPYSRYTHQIAIPLSTSSELTSALHDIQTSLVRDCPRLIRACIMPATLRLPLLYVDAGASSIADGESSIFSTSNEVDMSIQKIVREAISSVIYKQNPADLDGIGDLELPEPIMLPFRGLELQGEDNSVLYAIGHNINSVEIEKDKYYDEDGVYIVDDWAVEKKESGYERLELLVSTVQAELEKRGYKTAWPSDEPQGNELFPGEDATIAALRAKQKKWRPRVPFVRLPNDFYDGLDDAQPDKDDTSGIGMQEIDAFFAKGFDGISPTFWYETWAEDDILPSPGVRMRSVQVYRRMISGGGEAESSFYELPPIGSNTGTIDSMDLPIGDAKLTEKEKSERVKERERMGEIENEAEREWEEGKAQMIAGKSSQVGTRPKDFDGDFDTFDISMETGDVVVDGDAAYSSTMSGNNVGTATEALVENLEDYSERSSSESNAPLKEITVEMQTSITQQASSSKKELPNIEDNPVFQRLWKGEAQLNAQGESKAQSLDGAPTSNEALPPYPSDEHFTGIWKVVQSPLGVSLEDESSQSSDNLILRVDGQVMGGPVLDSKCQHKAAGGYWKMFQAVRKSKKNIEDNEAPITQTRLRIKLLVPPEKERMLVMEGEVTRVGFGGKVSTSSSAYSSNGGMLDGMSSAKLLKDGETVDSETGSEQVLYCGGESWLENVDGSGKRRKLGPFSLTKLKTVDRSKLIYTVPASRGGPTEENETD